MSGFSIEIKKGKGQSGKAKKKISLLGGEGRNLPTGTRIGDKILLPSPTNPNLRRWQSLSDFEEEQKKRKKKKPDAAPIGKRKTIGKHGGPGILGLTRNELFLILKKASDRGKDEGKEGSQFRESWVSVWTKLFPPGSGVELSTHPDGNIDPIKVKFDFDKLYDDPHGGSVVSFRDLSGKRNTCVTYARSIKEDFSEWKALKEQGVDEDPDKILSGLLGEESGKESFKDLYHRLNSVLNGDSEKDKQAAAVLLMMMKTGHSQGEVKEYLKNGGNRGLLTLHPEDVTVKGDKISISFPFEKTKNKASFSHAGLAKLLNSQKEKTPQGKRLFSDVSEQDLNSLLSGSSDSKIKNPQKLRSIHVFALGKKAFEAAKKPTKKVEVYKNEVKEVNGRKKKKRVRSMEDLDIVQSFRRGKISQEELLEAMAQHIFGVISEIQKKIGVDKPSISRDNFIHPEIIYSFVEKIGADDIVQGLGDKYAVHRDEVEKSVETLLSKVGFSILLKSESESFEEKKPSGKYHWPFWLLQYGLNQEEQENLKAGKDISLSRFENIDVGSDLFA